MVTMRRPGEPSSVVDFFPTRHLPAPAVRDMPEPPSSFRRVIGPGIVAAGVGMASGEFILNRRVLPPRIRPGAGRVAALVWSVLLFGLLSVLTFNQQIRTLFGIE